MTLQAIKAVKAKANDVQDGQPPEQDALVGKFIVVDDTGNQQTLYARILSVDDGQAHVRFDNGAEDHYEVNDAFAQAVVVVNPDYPPNPLDPHLAAAGKISDRLDPTNADARATGSRVANEGASGWRVQSTQEIDSEDLQRRRRRRQRDDDADYSTPGCRHSHSCATTTDTSLVPPDVGGATRQMGMLSTMESL